MSGNLITSRKESAELASRDRLRSCGFPCVDRYSVLNDKRKPIGYLDVSGLKQKFEAGSAKEVNQSCLSCYDSQTLDQC